MAAARDVGSPREDVEAVLANILGKASKRKGKRVDLYLMAYLAVLATAPFLVSGEIHEGS